jgi:predicted outer membrane protein
MLNEHTMNLQQTQELSKRMDVMPVYGQTAMTLKQQGAVEGKKLKHATKNSFNQLFINDMVKDHKAALQLLTKLNAMATNPALKAQLQATQGHVQEHLNRALAIKNKMNY